MLPISLPESNTGKAVKEFDQREYYIASHYHSVFDSLKLFAEDELLCKPGNPSSDPYFTHFLSKALFQLTWEHVELYMLYTFWQTLYCYPGSEYHYTTHGWTLISAIIEKVSDKKFLDYMKDHVFKPLAMTSTRGEYHQPLIYSRARYTFIII